MRSDWLFVWYIPGTETSVCKWLFQLDDEPNHYIKKMVVSPNIHWKMKNWLFRVPGSSYSLITTSPLYGSLSTQPISTNGMSQGAFEGRSFDFYQLYYMYSRFCTFFCCKDFICFFPQPVFGDVMNRFLFNMTKTPYSASYVGNPDEVQLIAAVGEKSPRNSHRNTQHWIPPETKYSHLKRWGESQMSFLLGTPSLVGAYVNFRGVLYIPFCFGVFSEHLGNSSPRLGFNLPT